MLEPTEHYLAGFDGALLTCRYVADAPLPTDAEQYAAAIQSATVETALTPARARAPA